MHHKDTQQQATLSAELNHLKELNRQITQEAHDLSTALRGQKKTQGNWGELILENVLERSGLRAGKDFQREVSMNNAEGKRQRPDVLVYLPQDKHLIIDAKVSLNAYTRYINSEDEAERRVALSEHVQSVSDRIRELSDRNYFELPGLNAPEMVFMFIPIESAFVEALKADESLFQRAIEQNVLVATPTTLLTSLNIVRQLWRFEDQNRHTAELAERAGKIHDKLRTFLASMDGIEGSLEKASQAYRKARDQLVDGRGNLVKQVNEFKELGVSVKAELSEEWTDRAALELSHERSEETP
ncbi:DNA recombination protein RmuC [Halopseudomonas pachastrellae]|nr:DNA recombination protein RmuC [Halopseudomonas pachastrellae]